MTFLGNVAFAILGFVCVPIAQARSDLVIPDAQVTYTTIDFPGAATTSVYGINSAGDIVGSYSPVLGSANHGFLLSGGQFTSFDYPGAVSTGASGINDTGLIVGTQDGSAFTYDGNTFTAISFPGYSSTEGDGINNAGDVVGRLNLGLRAYEYSGGQFKIIRVPGNNRYQGAGGINNHGDIVGYRIYGGYQSFLYKNGKFQFFNLGDSTVPFGINDNDVIVGWYSVNGKQSGFAFLNGKYVIFNYPNSYSTTATGINRAGQVVGVYTDGIGSGGHGFVTSPLKASDFK
jgi:probable HAF family extracellular repeat protein